MLMAFIHKILAIIYPHRDLTCGVRVHSIHLDAKMITACSYCAVFRQFCLLFLPLLSTASCVPGVVVTGRVQPRNHSDSVQLS